MSASTGNKAVKPRPLYPIWPVCLSLLILCLVALIAFGFSARSKISTLSVSGNSLYSVKEIYAIADIAPGDSLILDSPWTIESRLEKDPLIERATVKVDGTHVSIAITEKPAIGYLQNEDGTLSLLLTDGEQTAIEEGSALARLKSRLPLIHDLDQDTIRQIVRQYARYPQYLKPEITEKIAEITHWEESYDDNMLRLVMQDGNEVFTSLASFFMIGRYQDALTLLTGHNVCLQLDGANHTMSKVSCDAVFMSQEEREAQRMMIRQAIAEDEKAAKEKEQQEKEEQARQEAQEKKNQDQPADGSDPSQAGLPQNPETPAPETPDQPAPAPETPEPSNWQQADDWQASQYSWLQYSPSLNIYTDYYGQAQYRFDEASQSFVEVASATLDQ